MWFLWSVIRRFVRETWLEVLRTISASKNDVPPGFPLSAQYINNRKSEEGHDGDEELSEAPRPKPKKNAQKSKKAAKVKTNSDPPQPPDPAKPNTLRAAASTSKGSGSSSKGTAKPKPKPRTLNVVRANCQRQTARDQAPTPALRFGQPRPAAAVQDVPVQSEPTAKYEPNEFSKRRWQFIEASDKSFEEANKDWMTSFERASYLATLDVGELKRRRFAKPGTMVNPFVALVQNRS